MSDGPDDGGFEAGAVLSPEQLAELLASLPDLGDPELPAMQDEPDEPPPAARPSHPRGSTARAATAAPMIGFSDGPRVPEVTQVGAPALDRRPEVVRLADAAPDLDPDAARSLTWLFR